MAPLRSLSTSVALIGVLACSTPAVATDEFSRKLTDVTPSELDVALATVALNIECLQAEYYSWAAYGSGLSDEDSGGGPGSIGGMKASLGKDMKSYAKQFAGEDILHLSFLRGIAGDIACPKMDIGDAFAALGDITVGETLDPPFSPYASDEYFLLGAFILEDVLVTYLNGVVSLISNSEIAGVAATNLSAQAYQAGFVRTMLSIVRNKIIPEYGATWAEGANALSNVRAEWGNGGEGLRSFDNFAEVDKKGKAKDVADIAPTDSNGFGLVRSAEEVMAILYFGDAYKAGGFFPDGINESYFGF